MHLTQTMDGLSADSFVTVDSLRIHGKHGHYAHERNVEQEFDVALVVGFDTRKAAQSDNLKDTLDYDTLQNIVTSIFSKKSKYLVESLAEEIASQILNDSRVSEVMVSIKKVAVWKEGIPGVKIIRKRP